jgi:DNA-binding MarR family transcriptional regulator
MDDQEFSGLVRNIITIKPMIFHAFGKPFPLNSDITPGAYYLMLYLNKNENQSMSNLGKVLLISKPNVTALVNKLIAKGLVVRSSDKQDRRIIMIRLSSKGIQFVERNNKNYLNQIKKILALVEDKELELLSVSMQNINDILSRLSLTDVNQIKK